jgi:c-di-AMP phosphodiesterase-like protein
MKKILNWIKCNMMQFIISIIAAVFVVIMVIWGVNKLISLLLGVGIISSINYLKKRERKLNNILLDQETKIEEVNNNYDNPKFIDSFTERRRKERKGRSKKNK